MEMRRQYVKNNQVCSISAEFGSNRKQKKSDPKHALGLIFCLNRVLSKKHVMFQLSVNFFLNW